MSLFDLFTRKKSADKGFDPPKYTPERLQQKIEDERVQLEMDREAERLFTEWNTAEDITVNGRTFRNYIPVINPFTVGAYRIYDEDAAQFKGMNITKLISKKFMELKANSENIIGE